MAAGDSLMSQLSGLFKEVYATEIKTAIPECAKLLKEVPFESRAPLGNRFHQPIVLTGEQGVTYAAPGAGNFALGSSISLNSQDAQIDGYQMVLSAGLDYESMARSIHGGKASFATATSVKVKNVLSSMRKRTEASLWYGQEGIGIVSTTTAIDATNTTVVVTSATFMPLLFAGLENAEVVFYVPTTNVRIGTEPAAGSPGAYTITSVDVSAGSFNVVSSAADATALDAVVGGDGVRIFFRFSVAGSAGTFAYNEMMGISPQLTSTATRFNINPALYNLWQGNSYDVGSQPLTFKKVITAVGQAVNRGLDEDVDVWIPVSSWDDLLSDQAALRKYDQSFSDKQLDQGSQSIKFHSVNGAIKITAHGMLKNGDAFVLPMGRDHILRIGAYDIAFVQPVAGDFVDDGAAEFFTDPSRAGVFFRCYSHQAIILMSPAKSVKMVNIVPTV
jgi:hypothetical protein